MELHSSNSFHCLDIPERKAIAFMKHRISGNGPFIRSMDTVEDIVTNFQDVLKEIVIYLG